MNETLKKMANMAIDQYVEDVSFLLAFFERQKLPIIEIKAFGPILRVVTTNMIPHSRVFFDDKLLSEEELVQSKFEGHGINTICIGPPEAFKKQGLPT